MQNLAGIYVALIDPREREISQHRAHGQTRKQILAKLPKELRVSVAEVAAISTGAATAAVQYVARGPGSAQARRSSRRKMGPEIKKHPAVVDFDTNLIVGKPELRVCIDRDRAADLGVSVADVADTLRMLVGGLKVSTYAEHGEEYDVRLRADAAYRRDVSGIALMTVPSRKYGTVPLSSVVTTSEGTGPSQVNRLGRQRQVTFMANVAPGFGESDVVKVDQGGLREARRSAEYRLVPTGRSKSSAELGAGLPARLRAVVRLHVPDPRGAVRVLAAPGHHPDLAAADGAVRAALADPLQAGLEPDVRARACSCCSAS